MINGTLNINIKEKDKKLYHEHNSYKSYKLEDYVVHILTKSDDGTPLKIEYELGKFCPRCDRIYARSRLMDRDEVVK